jgi:hypothetical protein
LVLVVGQHLKHRLLVNDFAAERIHETNIVTHVCADEWVGFVVARDELVDDYSLINKVDAKGAASQLAIPVFKVVWRADDGGNAMRGEMIPQENKFVGCRRVLRIENRNVWHGRAAPFAISAKQRFEQSSTGEN